MQCEYLKYLLVAISARHHQFRHTTKPANRSSPLTTRTTLLNSFHYFTSWNKECTSCGDRTHDHNIKSIALYHWAKEAGPRSGNRTRNSLLHALSWCITPPEIRQHTPTAEGVPATASADFSTNGFPRFPPLFHTLPGANRQHTGPH